MSILVMGQCFSSRGLLSWGTRAVRRRRGLSSFGLAVKLFWLEAGSARAEVGELNPRVRLYALLASPEGPRSGKSCPNPPPLPLPSQSYLALERWGTRMDLWRSPCLIGHYCLK